MAVSEVTDFNGRRALIIDIGGGSTEFIITSGGEPDLLFKVSRPGCGGRFGDWFYEPGDVKAARTSKLLVIGALSAAVVANAIYSVGPADDPYGNGSGLFFGRLMVVAFALLLASILMRDEQTRLGRVLSSRALVALGTISYGIYLWHFLIIQRLRTSPVWWIGETNLVLGERLHKGTLKEQNAYWYLFAQ